MANKYIKGLKIQIILTYKISVNHKEPSLQHLLDYTYLEIRRLYFVSQFAILGCIPKAYLCG